MGKVRRHTNQARKKKENNALIVQIEHLSTEDISTHLKQCSVKVLDIRHNLKNDLYKPPDNFNNEEKQVPDESSAIVCEVENVPRKFNLRKRPNKINYADVHRGSSLLNEKPAIHVPIYNQKVPVKKTVPADVYEFDSDSEKKERNQRRKNTLDASIPFEKEMKLEMRKIENTRKKQSKKQRKMNIAIQAKEIKNIKNSVAKVNSNLRNKIDINVEHREESKDSALLKHNISTYNSSPVRYDDTCTNDNREDLSDIDMAPLELEICTVEKSTKINIAHKVPEFRLNILQNIDLSRFMETDVSSEYETINSYLKNSKLLNLDMTQNTKSDLSIQPDNTDATSEQDIAEFFSCAPVQSPKATSTPWRPDFKVKRNPFFLQYKETSLPSYNQEMVIDSTVEKVLLGHKTQKNNDNQLKTKQTTILSYVNGNSICDSPNVIESSLYDIHEFSPVKTIRRSMRKSSKSSSEKENQLSKDTPIKENDFSKVKRRILGERVDNSLNISNNSNVRIFGDNRKSNGDREISYFGFNSSASSAEKNKELQKPAKKATWLFGKPTRLDDYLVAKTTKNRAINKNFKNKSNEVAEEVTINSDNEEETQKIDEGSVDVEQQFTPNMGLFEDLEPAYKDVSATNWCCFDRIEDDIKLHIYFSRIHPERMSEQVRNVIEDSRSM